MLIILSKGSLFLTDFFLIQLNLIFVGSHTNFSEKKRFFSIGRCPLAYMPRTTTNIDYIVSEQPNVAARRQSDTSTKLLVNSDHRTHPKQHLGQHTTLTAAKCSKCAETYGFFIVYEEWGILAIHLCFIRNTNKIIGILFSTTTTFEVENSALKLAGEGTAR